MADKSVFDDMLASVGAAPHTGKGNLIDSFPLDGFTQLEVPGAEPAPSAAPAARQYSAPPQPQPPAPQYTEPAPPQYAAPAPQPYTAPAQPPQPSAPQTQYAAPAQVQFAAPAAPQFAEPLPPPFAEPLPPQYSAPAAPRYPAAHPRPQPYMPPPDAPDEEDEDELPPAVFAAQRTADRTGPGAGALELVKARYEQAVSLEYYQMQQVGRLQIVTAILLSAAGVTLSLCFSRSVPGYFEFYISACACPIALALVLALVFSVVRPPQDGLNRPPVKEDLTYRELYDIYISLQEEVSLANRRRAAAIRRNKVLLWLCVALCIGFIITGVGIGA